ncbi:hypothetical protein ACVWWJ_002706 [Luteibacter sp. HA06]
MALYSLKDLQHSLDVKFAHQEPMLTGFRLLDGGLDDERVVHAESVLGVSFPRAFREAIKLLSFEHFTIGPVAFCYTGDYLAEMMRLNISVHWWGEGPRPAEWLMVANSDPYAILISIDTGAIWVMDPERGSREAVCVAPDFDIYLRGVGTVILERNIVADKVALARNISSEVGGLGAEYWDYLAK